MTPAELERLQLTMSQILETLKKIEARWVHTESSTRYGIDELKEISRHVRDISLHIKGI